MEFVRSLAWILGFWTLGEAIARVAHLPVPGSVIGMLALYLALRLGLVKTAWVEVGARGLLGVLALLFVPAGAGVIAYASPAWWGIGGAVLVLTPLLIVALGVLVQRLAH